MATTSPSGTLHLAEAHRKLRSPLARLRGTIHTYVTLEGGALVLLLLAAWFWAGLVLDYAPFAFFRLDWLTVFPWFVRLAMLLVLVGLVGFLVARRINLNMRQFADAALALLLERKFPKLLGDRLITAVELADPEKAAEYGYSRSMVQETIRQAAERIDEVPVSEVFDWRRLYMRWILAVVATVGVYLVVAPSVMATYAFRHGSAWRGLHDFHDVLEIYVERNFLLQDTRWLFDSEFVVVSPRDQQRFLVGNKVNVVVRANRLMVADTTAPRGWRPAVWQDLKDHPEYAGGEAPRRDPPPEWKASSADGVLTLDEIDVRLNSFLVRRVPADGAGPVTWQRHPKGRGSNGEVDDKDWRPLLWAELRDQTGGMALPVLAAEVSPICTAVAATALPLHPVMTGVVLAMTPVVGNQTYDQVAHEFAEQNDKSRAADMRSVQADLERLDEMNKILARVSQSANEPKLSRKLRELQLPQSIKLHYSGKEDSTDIDLFHDARDPYLYSGTIDALDGGEYKYHATALDFTTPPRHFSMVPPPKLVKLTGQQRHPAYLYHRSSGVTAWPGAAFWAARELRGERQEMPPVDYSNYAGGTVVFDVPSGSDVRLTGKANCQLGEVKLVPASAGHVELVEDDGFAVTIVNARDTGGKDFTVEFYDRDGIKGERTVRVQAHKDEAPTLPDLQPETVRMTKDGYKVTVGARIPFRGRVEDEGGGLQRVQYRYRIFKKDTMPPPSPKAKLSLATSCGLACAPQSASLLAVAALLPSGNELLRAIAPDVLIRSGTASLPGFDAALAESTANRLSPSELASKLTDIKAGVRDPKSFVTRYVLTPDPWDDKATDVRGRPAPHYVTSNDFLISALGLKVEKGTQERYGIELIVEALDYNIEGDRGGDGIARPQVTATQTFKFLVVDQDDLEREIDKEQMDLFVKIAAVNLQLKDNLRKINQEQSAVVASRLPDLKKTDPADYEKHFLGVRDRLDRLRSQLEDYHNTVHTVRQAYDRIGEEMRLNDFTSERMNQVTDRVILPLHRLDDAVKDQEHRDGNNFELTVVSLQRYYVELGKLQQASPETFAEVMASCQTLAAKADDDLTRLQKAVESLAEYLKEQDGFTNITHRLAEIRLGEAESAEKLKKMYKDFIEDILREK